MGDDELVEHIAADGSVIEIVTRSAVRERRLRHRCTYIVVIDSADRVVVHQRADWKDVYPSYWDVAFGGICDVDESWSDAAARELAEEAGLTSELTELAAVSYDEPDGAVVGRVFLARTDDEPTCPDGEVVATDRVSRAELATWAEGRDLCLDSRAVVLPLILDL